VGINVRSCDCRWWQLTGTPCYHAIACFSHDEISPETMVHECYSIETYMQSYGYNIWPVRDKIHWEKMNGVDVQPPIYDKKVGRPAKNRKKNPIELEGGTKLSNTWSENALPCLWVSYTQQENLPKICGSEKHA